MSNDKNNKINIFEDRDTLIRIWEKERDTRNFNVTLMWENVKYFSGIIGALLVVHTALLSLISSQNYGVFPLDLREAVLVFPIAVIVLWFFAYRNIKILQDRFLLVVTHLLKLELLLWLHDDITDWLIYFKKDKYLFPRYRINVEPEIDTECFIKKQMKKEVQSAYKLMPKVYWIFAMIAIGLATFDIFIILLNLPKP